jgi:Tfp pilus assembly protein PilN
VSARLASELRRSVLFFKQTFRASVDRVVVCGDMPDVRTLTAPLGEAVSLPVSAADSLAGLDASSIPEPAAQFRTEVAALRLAIASGAETVPPINLLPDSIRVGRESRARTVRLSGSVAASVAVVAAAYVFVGRTSAQYETEQAKIQNELASLEPEARHRDQLRGAYALAASQGLALAAFDSQGPRLTRFLEALSAATPDEIVLSSVSAEADGMRWNTTVTGIAVTPDAASGQAAVNALLRRLAESPFAGAPVDPPSFRMVSGSGAATGTSGDATHRIAEGMSGVEFELHLRVEK